MNSKGNKLATIAHEAPLNTQSKNSEQHRELTKTLTRKALFFLCACAFVVSLVRRSNNGESALLKDPGVKDEEDKNTRFLLEQKLAGLNMTGHVCMAWWVSSVVFCGSILAAVWLKRTELSSESRVIIHLLGGFLCTFFIGVVLFGSLIIWHLFKVDKDIANLVNKLGQKNHFATELLTFKVAMVIGAISFLLILGVWIILWRGLAFGWWKN